MKKTTFSLLQQGDRYWIQKNEDKGGPFPSTVNMCMVSFAARAEAELIVSALNAFEEEREPKTTTRPKKA